MIGYQDKINQILRGAETIKNMTNRPNLTVEEKEHYNKVAMDLIYKDTDLELSVSVLTKTLEKVQLERDEAIRLATLFQILYLRLGKAEDKFYNTLMVQGAAKSLADLKGLRYFGEVNPEEVEYCDE
jgi:hypothetical protein